MVTKRKEQTEPAVNAEFDVADFMTGDELNPALQQIFAELGGDSTVKITVYISKLIADSNKEARVWNGPPDEYDLMATARRFGSGDYRVKIYGPTDRGNPGIRLNQVIPIMLDATEDARLLALRKGEPIAPGVMAVSGNSDMATIVQAVIAAIKPQLPQVVAPVDPFAMFEKFAGAMAKMMPPQQIVPQAGASGMRDVLEAARMIAEISGGNGNERADRSNGKDYAVTRGVDLLSRIFEKHLESAQPALPAPNASSKQPVAGQLTEEEQLQLDMIKTQLRMANMAARSNTDPKEFADSVFDMLPDTVIHDWAENPQWFELLCAHVPDCKPHQEWYAKVREAILAFAVEEGVLQQTADSVTKVDAPNAGNAAPTGTGKAE